MYHLSLMMILLEEYSTITKHPFTLVDYFMFTLFENQQICFDPVTELAIIFTSDLNIASPCVSSECNFLHIQSNARHLGVPQRFTCSQKSLHNCISLRIITNYFLSLSI